MLDDMTLQMSMFAPVDFSQMRRSDLGISLLDDRLYASRLRNVRLYQLITFAILYDVLLCLYFWQPDFFNAFHVVEHTLH